MLYLGSVPSSVSVLSNMLYVGSTTLLLNMADFERHLSISRGDEPHVTGLTSCSNTHTNAVTVQLLSYCSRPRYTTELTYLPEGA